MRSRAARRGHLSTGPGGSGDRHHLRRRVRDQGTAGVPVTADDVEHARRQELGGDLGQQQRSTPASCRDGFSTTVLPAAIAGANFQTAIIIG